MPKASAAQRIAALAALLVVLAVFRVWVIEHAAIASDSAPLAPAVAASAAPSIDGDGMSPFIASGGVVPDPVDEPADALAFR